MVVVGVALVVGASALGEVVLVGVSVLDVEVVVVADVDGPDSPGVSTVSIM